MIISIHCPTLLSTVLTANQGLCKDWGGWWPNGESSYLSNRVAGGLMVKAVTCQTGLEMDDAEEWCLEE